MKSRIIPLIVAVSLLIFSVEDGFSQEDAWQGKSGRITAKSVVIRARPGTHYESLGRFVQNDEVKIVSETDDWYRVVVPDTVIGWVPESGVDAKGTVHKSVPVFAGPGVVFSELGTVQEGDVLRIQNRNVDGFWPVNIPSGVTAWVSKTYVELKEPVFPEAKEPEEVIAQPDVSDEEKVAALKAKNEALEAERESEEKRLSGLQATVATLDAEAEALKAAAEAAKRLNEARFAAAEVEKEKMAADAKRQEEEMEALRKQRDALIAERALAEKAMRDAEEAAAQAKAKAAEAEEARKAAEAAIADAEAATKEVEARRAQAEKDAAEAKEAEEKRLAAEAAEKKEPVIPQPVEKSGYLMALGQHSNKHASHALCVRRNTRVVPVCYVRSKGMDLSRWENMTVTVTGQEKKITGWTVPVMEVDGVMRKK